MAQELYMFFILLYIFNQIYLKRTVFASNNINKFLLSVQDEW